MVAADAARRCGQPLTCVNVVCRSYPAAGANDAVVHLIDGFVDPSSRLKLVDASARALPGLLRLLKRIAAHDAANLEALFKRQIFSRALVHAVRHGDIKVVQWLVEEYQPTGKIRRALNQAAACGQLEILMWLIDYHEARLVWNGEELDLAAEGNHLVMTQWLIEYSGRFDGGVEHNMGNLLTKAAQHGNLEMALWVAQQCQLRGVQLDPSVALAVAALNGHLSLMEFVRDQFGGSYSQKCFDNAIAGGQLEVAKWLHVHSGFVRTKALCLLKVAHSGDAALAEWVLDNIELDDRQGLGSLIESAATAGHLDVLRLFHKHFDGQCTTRAMDNAARYGHFDVVKWLHANRSEGCTSSALPASAGNGHLEIAQWLHANRSDGGSFNGMDLAAKNNHLNTIQWLHMNRIEGCSAIAMDDAASGGHLDIVRWLHENRREGCSQNAMTKAARNGHLDVIKWLHNNRSEGCTSSAIDDAAGNGHLDIAMWLDTNRTERCSSIAFHGTARNGHVDVVKWLLANKRGLLGPDALPAAVEGGNFEIVLAIDQFTRSMYDPTIELFRRARGDCHYEIFEWLLREFGDSTIGLDSWLRQQMRIGSFDYYTQDIVHEWLNQHATTQSG